MSSIHSLRTAAKKAAATLLAGLVLSTSLPTLALAQAASEPAAVDAAASAVPAVTAAPAAPIAMPAVGKEIVDNPYGLSAGVIPIVLVAGDVLNTGIVSNLARPEANITGFVAVNVELEEKRLELLKDIVPHLKRVAVLGNSLNPLNRVNLEIARRAAAKLSVTIETFEVQSSGEVANALAALTGKRPDAALIASDTLLLSERQRIVDTLAKSGIPAIYPFREYATVGGFIIYGANISALFENAAGYVDRILKGEKPGDLPVQQATAFEMIINLKAATKLGLTLPPNVLVRADEVIE